MKIIKLWEKLRRQANSESEAEKAAFTELRLHPRYSVERFSLFKLYCQNTESHIPVQDISYGGLAIFASDRPSSWQQSSAIPVSLLNIGRSCNTKIIPIHKSNQQIGYSFIHESTSTLTFLRPVLEDLRLGYTLQPIAEQWRKAELQGKNWHVLRGDGAVDLVYDLNPKKQKIVDLMLTFLEDKTYHELRFQNEKWKTLQSASEPGVAVRMLKTSQLDITTIHRSINILVGTYSRFHEKALAELIEQLIAILKPARKQENKRSPYD